MPEMGRRVAALRARMREAEERFGRRFGVVQVLAVSKMQCAQAIRRAHTLGLAGFGENYLQEAEGKITALCDLRLEWHFIGRIQTNKTRLIAALFDWVHTLDRVALARRLNEQRPVDRPPLNVCIQINISGEATKGGCLPAEAADFAHAIQEFPRLRLRGLMALPAPTDDFDQQRLVFRPVHELYQILNDRGAGMDTLSMGTSGDFEAAIAEGATMIRLGTTIFGSRPTP
ncbi:MAG: YggS family pyridoxal phosphate-dependent enzyme [Gammaproteobacteria bacterium]